MQKKGTYEVGGSVVLDVVVCFVPVPVPVVGPVVDVSGGSDVAGGEVFDVEVPPLGAAARPINNRS